MVDKNPTSQIKSLQDLNSNILEMMRNNNEGKNILFSSLGVYLLMAMSAEGLIGDTKDEIINTFGFDSNAILNEETLKAVNSLGENKLIVIEVVNSILASTKFPIKSDFTELLNGKYHSKCDNVDFSNEDEIKKVNNWIDQKTNGLIKEIISEPDSYTIMMLVNVIYFKAKWHKVFEKTCQGEFLLESGEAIMATYLQDKRPVRAIISEDEYTILELEYIGRDYSMVLLLDLQGGIIDSSLIFDVFDLDQEVYPIKVPKFKFDHKVEFLSYLKEMGIEKFFQASEDFTKITKVSPCFVSSVFQKSVICVNEEGTEASSTTANTFTSKAIAKDEIVFDRPFYFFIVEKKKRVIVFSGYVANPSYK